MNGAQQQLVTVLTDKDVEVDVARAFAEQVTIGPGCWHWRGSLTSRGYPRFFYGGDQSGVYAYRWLFSVLYGEPQPGERLIRTCHVPWCVAPRHIRPTSHGGALSHGAKARRERHLESIR